MKNIKAVVTDLNGTLLLPDGTIGNFTRKVINQLVKEGKKFYIATGRSKNEIFKLVKGFNLNETQYITLNGARVYDTNWKELIKHNLNTNIINKIIENKVKNKDFIHCIYKIEGQNDKLYINLSDLTKIQMEDELIDKSNRNFEHIENLESFKNDSNIAAILVSNEENKLLEYKKNFLSTHNNINVFLSNPTTLEIVDINASKGKALKEVLGKYNISLDEVVAFGNGFNDLDILTMTHKGIMTENANESLKKALPDFEIIGPTIKESVANYINEKILINPI